MSQWKYEQATGKTWQDGVYRSTGYSGFGAGKNNPAMQQVAGVGPVPVGAYRLSAPFTSPHAGPLAFRLEPLEGTNTYGRTLLEAHGDSIAHPGSASHGCIILDRATRALMAQNDVIEVI